MNAITNLQADTRSATTWPLHKAKARLRKADRKRIARAAQKARDAEANKKL